MLLTGIWAVSQIATVRKSDADNICKEMAQDNIKFDWATQCDSAAFYDKTQLEYAQAELG